MGQDNLVIWLAALPFAANAMLTPARAQAQPVRTISAACAIVKTRAASRGYFRPRVVVGSCEALRDPEIPRGYYVLTLHSTRRCDYICSSLLGYFAVRRSTGQVFEWDISELRLGREIRPRR